MRQKICQKFCLKKTDKEDSSKDKDSEDKPLYQQKEFIIICTVIGLAILILVPVIVVVVCK